jgi:nucleotide-binding universal stress UspA family protein
MEARSRLGPSRMRFDFKESRTGNDTELNPDSVRKAKDDQPSTRIAAHLSQHGIATDVRELPAEDVGVGDMILSPASDTEADLIVIAAYGQPRAREIILGGATRALFNEMTVPLLMSH